MINSVNIANIDPNPWAPERVEDSQALEELAQSILTHGLIEYPVGRSGENGRVLLAAGHRRLAAYRLLAERGNKGFSEIPVRIEDLTDQQLADISLQENQKRKDLDPISEARFYQKYMESFKVSQTKLAELVGISQGELSNHVRLLELPDEAQGMIISREITPRHGREILRASRLPEAQKGIVHRLKEQPGLRVEDLRFRVDRELADNGRPLNGYYDGHCARFDTEPCKKCKDRSVLQYAHYADKNPFCLNPECWERKQEEWRKSQLVEAEAEGQGDVIKKLPYGSYETLSDYVLRDQLDNPEECKTCEHHKRMENYGSIDDVCTNLKCFRSKKRKRTIVENKRKAEAEQQLTDTIEIALKKGENDDALWRELDLMVLEAMLRSGITGLTGWFLKLANISVGKDKEYSAPDRLPSLLKDMPNEDLQKLQLRLAMQILRYNRMDRVKHYLRKLEGGPDIVTLKHPDGTEEDVEIDRIYQMTYRSRQYDEKKNPEHCYAYIGEESGNRATPITAECFLELDALGVRSKWDYSSLRELRDEGDGGDED